MNNWFTHGSKVDYIPGCVSRISRANPLTTGVTAYLLTKCDESPSIFGSWFFWVLDGFCSLAWDWESLHLDKNGVPLFMVHVMFSNWLRHMLLLDITKGTSTGNDATWFFGKTPVKTSLQPEDLQKDCEGVTKLKSWQLAWPLCL